MSIEIQHFNEYFLSQKTTIHFMNIYKVWFSVCKITFMNLYIVVILKVL